MSDFETPAHWLTCRTAELAELIRGVSYQKSDARATAAPGHKPILRANNINGVINLDDLVYVPESVVSDDQLLRAGDILFAMSSGSRNLVGKSARVSKDIDAGFGAFCGVLRPSREISSEFLFWVFQTREFRRAISEVSKGSNINNLKREHLLDYEIPLPPLAEQKRIVAKIEELFSELEAGEESLRVARRQLGVYRQSLLKQAFEGHLTAEWRTQNPAKLESPAQLLARIQSARQDRAASTRSKIASLAPFPADELVGDFTLPAGWLVLPYGDLCSVVRNGISQKPSGDTGHKIARISAVRPMVFDYEDYRFIDCDDETAADYTLANGDLVFTRYNGARRFVGVCAQFKGNEPRLYPDKLIRTRPNLPMLDPRYLEIALNCGLSRAWLETKIRTTAGQSGVSGGDVKAMPVPICSLPEQQEIVRLLDEQFEVIERNERELDGALRQSEALRQAILQKAFTGRLVPQSPADESASVLLARLRSERSRTRH